MVQAGTDCFEADDNSQDCAGIAGGHAELRQKPVVALNYQVTHTHTYKLTHTHTHTHIQAHTPVGRAVHVRHQDR